MTDRPKSIPDIRKNPQLMAAYLAWLKREAKLNEFTFMAKGGNNFKAIWETYLAPKASQAVNLSSAVNLKAKALAEKNDWTNPEWIKVISSGQEEVLKELTLGLRDFSESKEYKDFLLKERMGDPAKAAKILGISDVKTLKAMMEARALGDKKAFQNLWKILAKKEKELMKEELMWKNMEKYF